MKCTRCPSEFAYQDSSLWICPECGHEWSITDTQSLEESTEKKFEVLDANGTPLQDGDSVTIIKDLKVKGSTSSLKVGTKIKSIRLYDGPDGHNLSCKIEGFGAMNLKSEFVKKST